jgi:hypothetical protein
MPKHSNGTSSQPMGLFRDPWKMFGILTSRERAKARPRGPGQNVVEKSSRLSSMLMYRECWRAENLRVQARLRSCPNRRKAVAVVQQAWTSVRAVYTAAAGRRPIFDLSKAVGLDSREALAPLIILARRLVKISVFSSPDEVTKYLKTLSDECRAAVFRKACEVPRLVRILGLPATRLSIEQCSYLGRSLPYGGDRACAKALAAHQLNLTSEFEVSPELLQRAKNFARSLCRKAQPAVLSFPLTGGACLEKSRAEGGLASFLVEARGSMGESPYPESSLPGLSYEQASSLSADAALRNYLVQQLPAVPRAKALVIKERGGKTRIVTKSPGALVSLSHFCRLQCLSVLRGHHSTSKVLSGDIVTEELFGVGVVMSADLETASDLIPHSLAAAVWDGICLGKGLSPTLCRIGHLALGPQEVTWPNGETAVTCRGILMGLPLTWPILSLVQMFCAESAINRAWLLDPRWQPKPKSQPYFVCGDDLISIWTPLAIQEYESLMLSCGLRFSKGKHAISSHRGVFLEKIYIFRREGLYVSRAPLSRTVSDFLVPSPLWWLRFNRLSRSFPIKGLVTPSYPPGMEKSVPGWWDAGSCAWDLSKWVEPSRISRVQRVVFPYGHLGSLGLYRPRSLGGLGLLPPRGERTLLKRVCSRPFRRAAAILCTGSAQDVSALRSAWSYSVPSGWRSLACSDAESDFTAHSYRVRRRGKPYNPSWLPLAVRPSEYRERLIGFSSRSYTFMMGPEPFTPLIIPNLRKQVRAHLRRVLGKWRSVSPMGGTIARLEQRLREADDDLIIFATPLPPPYYPGPAPPIAAIGWVHHSQAQRGLPTALGWEEFLLTSVVAP